MSVGFVDPSVGWSVGFGWSVHRSVGLSIGRSVGRSVLVRWSIGRSVFPSGG